MYLLVNYVNHLGNERLPFAIDILHPYRIKKSRVQEFVVRRTLANVHDPIIWQCE